MERLDGDPHDDRRHDQHPRERRAPPRDATGITLAELAAELGLEPTKVAVERNLEVVPRSTLADVRVEDGDELEIVHFVGGGDHAAPRSTRMAGAWRAGTSARG